MHDLAVVIAASPGQPEWLRPCLTTLYDRLGSISADVVVADNGDEDARELVEGEFPLARVVQCENRGFAHACNRAALTCDARYVLFLNPDTEVLEGTLEALLERLDREPALGAAGVKQLSPDGTLHPTIRRFPTPLRILGEALGAERLGLGQRVLDPAAYERETPCDWTSGSFLLVRRQALESAGLFDERFFLFCEEIDLCKRLREAGWEIRHLPSLTILHHVGKGARARTVEPRMVQQNAFAQLQYARKHFGRAGRLGYRCALGLYYGLRLRRPALAVLTGRARAPFVEPPATALEPVLPLETYNERGRLRSS